MERFNPALKSSIKIKNGKIFSQMNIKLTVVQAHCPPANKNIVKYEDIYLPTPLVFKTVIKKAGFA